MKPEIRSKEDEMVLHRGGKKRMSERRGLGNEEEGNS